MALGFQVSIGTAPGLVAGQSFRTIPTPNFRPAIYSLAIRGPSAPFGLVAGFTFPISPASIKKEYIAMSTPFDVAGSPANRGVQRVIDQYGVSPLIWTIQGTTGWQFHSNDGFSATGIQAAIALQNLMWQFAELNQKQAQNGLPDLYHLEFYDYFTQEFWEVVPVGQQGITQDRSRPLLINYFFRLMGVRDLSQPTDPASDPIAASFAVSPGIALSVLSGQLSATLSAYANLTIKVA